jgi:hypothetical protein
MKRLLTGALVALGMAAAAAPAWADCYFDMTSCRHICFVRTGRNRCSYRSSYCNPLPCVGSCGFSASGPAPWNALAAYGPQGYAVAAAPAAAAPVAAPAAGQPAFRAPQPTPAANKANGLQQAGYFPYGQTNNTGYGYGAGYNYYGAGYGYGYYGYGANYNLAQVPNYWY